MVVQGAVIEQKFVGKILEIDRNNPVGSHAGGKQSLLELFEQNGLAAAPNARQHFDNRLSAPLFKSFQKQ